MTTYYVARDECITDGTHLVETDDDGYCNDCGYS